MSVTNLYPPFDSSSGNWSGWSLTTEKVQTQPVYSKDSAWGGLFNTKTDLVGFYTFSIYVKTDKANAEVAIFAHTMIGTLTDISTFDVVSVSGENARIRQRTETIASAGLYTLTNANQWYRISATIDFYSADCTGLRAECRDSNTTLYVSAPMLEVGNTLHNFVPYGGWIWHAHEGEYPINDKTALTLQTTFKRPYPASLWRIDESNGGYPYHDLMPNIVHYVPPPPPPPEPTNPECANWLSHWFIRKGDMDLNRESVMGYIS